jgi:putative FmdB family regulatory protein
MQFLAGGLFMPVYEYQCTECNKEFEIMQKMTDEPLSECSECGGKLKKLITHTSFVLKGTGWYVTDYPSSDRKKAMEEKKSGSESKDTKAKDSKTQDSKADKKTDTKKAVNA